MSLWVTVQGFVDREYLEEAVLNRPIRQLRERTDYLFRRVETLAESDVLSSLRLVDVPLATDTDYVPAVKDFVYLNPVTRVYEKALATIDVTKNLLFETDYPGYAVGLLIEKSADGTTGTVVIAGKTQLSDGSNWDMADLVETGETFRPGPYFLSAVERGKMTQYPNGPEIYLGYFTDDAAAPGTGGYALINPQYRSFAEAHIHQSFPLKMQPVGSQGRRLPEGSSSAGSTGSSTPSAGSGDPFPSASSAGSGTPSAGSGTPSAGSGGSGSGGGYVGPMSLFIMAKDPGGGGGVPFFAGEYNYAGGSGTSPFYEFAHDTTWVVRWDVGTAMWILENTLGGWGWVGPNTPDNPVGSYTPDVGGAAGNVVVADLATLPEYVCVSGGDQNSLPEAGVYTRMGYAVGSSSSPYDSACQYLSVTGAWAVVFDVDGYGWIIVDTAGWTPQYQYLVGSSSAVPSPVGTYDAMGGLVDPATVAQGACWPSTVCAFTGGTGDYVQGGEYTLDVGSGSTASASYTAAANPDWTLTWDNDGQRWTWNFQGAPEYESVGSGVSQWTPVSTYAAIGSEGSQSGSPIVVLGTRPNWELTICVDAQSSLAVPGTYTYAGFTQNGRPVWRLNGGSYLECIIGDWPRYNGYILTTNTGTDYDLPQPDYTQSPVGDWSGLGSTSTGPYMWPKTTIGTCPETGSSSGMMMAMPMDYRIGLRTMVPEVDDIHGFASEAAKSTYHGAHTGGTSATLTDAGAAFVVDNLIGLKIYNVTQDAVGTISDNDGTTITAVMETAGGVPVSWETDDQYYIEDRQRLVVIGQYTANDPTTYTCTLTDATGTTAPTSMSDLYIKYTSSDPDDSGLVQIPGYEYPVALGNKGLQVYLARHGGTGWDVIEQAAAGDITRRQYVFVAADETEGWVPNHFHEVMAWNGTTDYKNTLIITGGPTESDADSLINITIRVAPWCKLVYSGVPVDGDTVTIAGHVFEFDDDGSVTGTNTPVTIAGGDADATYLELLSVILDAELTGVHPVYHPTGNAFVIMRDGGVAGGAVAASVTDAVVTYGSIAPGDVAGFSHPNFAVYDANHYGLSSTVSPLVQLGYAYSILYLQQNLELRTIPFAVDGTPEVSHNATVGDYWTVELNNEAPGAAYRYNVGMNAALSALYPPIPLKAASFVLNGLELESFAHFPGNADYRVGYHGLYWYSDTELPWPSDWSYGGTVFTDPKFAVLHLIRPRAGETGIVRSLQPAPDSPISVTRCGTHTPASTGDLQIDVDLALRSRNDNLPDYNVFKRVVGNRLLAGPVVSKIMDGPGYTVVSPPGVPRGCGDVQLVLDSAGVGGDFDNIALQNAKHELIGLFPYIRLLGWTTGGNNVPSGFTAMFSLPSTLSGTYRFVVSMVLFGEDNITSGVRRNAGLTFTYSVLHDYMPEDDYKRNLVSGLITPATTPILWQVPIGEAGVTPVYTAYDPMVVHTSPDQAADTPAREYRASEGPYPKVNDLLGGTPESDINELALRAGTQVAIQIQRGPISSGTEYTGALGILNLRWRLLPVE